MIALPNVAIQARPSVVRLLNTISALAIFILGIRTINSVAILQRFAHSGYILFSTLDGYLDDDIDLAGVFRVPFNGSAEAASGGAALQQPGEKNDITGDPHLFMNCP